MQISEDIISKVIAFQGEDSLKAVKQYDEVEFSGFGKFYLSETKLHKALTNYQKALDRMRLTPEINPEKIERLDKVINELKRRVK